MDDHISVGRIKKFYCADILNCKVNVKFDEYEQLLYHWIYHHAEGEFQCKECDFNTPFLRFARDHYKDVHLLKNKPNVNTPSNFKRERDFEKGTSIKKQRSF